MANVKHSSETTSHFTPPNIVAAARLLLGNIELDPASTKWGNQQFVRANRILTYRDNGYLKDWGRSLEEEQCRVFLNPPGGRCNDQGRPVEYGGQSSAKAWWFKLAGEYMRKQVTSAIFIGFSLELLQTTQLRAANQHYSDDYSDGYLPVPLDFPCCYPSRRIKFLVKQGSKLIEGKSPTHANVIVYLPPYKEVAGLRTRNYHAFKHDFGAIGRCTWPQALPKR